MVRTPCCDENGRKKGTWTPEEDRKLAAYVTKYGCWNWRQLPKYAGLARCGKSCRLRWMNYLRPNVKRGNYTQEEDEIILKLHAQLGNKWSAIAVHLPGRSDNEIKNHWHTALKNSSKKCNTNKNSIRECVEINQNASPSIMSSHENIELESEDIVLEISQSSSSEELSSYRTTDYQEEGLVETSGCFWTEPFVVDSFSFNSRMDYCGLVCPPSPFIGHEFFSSFDFDHYKYC